MTQNLTQVKPNSVVFWGNFEEWVASEQRFKTVPKTGNALLRGASACVVAPNPDKRDYS
jgi:hypothetical protein